MTMRRSLRSQIRMLQAYVAISSLATIFLATAALRQPGQASPPSQRFGEINVERINIVDANGTLRLVISNKDRMHPGVVDGRVINRPRPYAGLLFFNDQGDEVGGLVTAGQANDGGRRASANFAFDQLKQDQVIAIGYEESNGRRSAALRVWDRPEVGIGDLIDKLNAANAIADPVRREAAVREARASQPGGTRRLFVGKDEDRSIGMSLADSRGQTRVSLKVDPSGAPVLEFLDERGNVIERLPHAK